MLLVLPQGNRFKEAEEIFETLLDKEKSPLTPDQKMFHMMIYMHKKAGNYEKARKLFALMSERGIEQCTVTYNSLMSFETNYKEVSKIYEQVNFMELLDYLLSGGVNMLSKETRKKRIYPFLSLRFWNLVILDPFPLNFDPLSTYIHQIFEVND